MSFFSGGKGKDKHKDKASKHKDKDARRGGGSEKKSQFYVEFLGWMECRGVRGRRYTEPVIHELRRRQKKLDKPPKLTIQLTAKDLKITQDFEEKRKRGSANIKKVTFPTIPARDVTYAVQATRPSSGQPDDIVACIYLGYMPRTQHYVHVHVYRFDEPSTASTFASLMNAIVDSNQARIADVERELADKGEIEDPRLASSDGMSDERSTGRGTGTDSAAGSGSVSGSGYSEDGGSLEGESPTFGSDEMEADLQSLSDVKPFDDVAAELKHRLRLGDGPLLLPPKDYDTISRARGNLIDINERRSHNLNIVGGEGTARPRNGSEESGIDLASPASDGGDVVHRFAGAYTQTATSGSGNTTPQLENGFVYPPRPERGPVHGGGYPGYPPPGSSSPAVQHVRQPSSPYSTHSSRASRGSDGNRSSGGGGPGDRGFPVYSRSNSSNSTSNINNNLPPGAGVMSDVDNGQGDLLPDYDDESFNEPVAMRPKAFPPPPFARPPSGAGAGSGSPMLMRSLPASVLQSEMALNSPRSPRGPRLGEGDEYFFNAERGAQSLYASQGNMNHRPQSAEYGQVRRVHSLYR